MDAFIREPRTDRPDRKDTRLVGWHVHETVHRALKVLAAERGISLAALLSEWAASGFMAEGKTVPQKLALDLTDFEKGGRRRNGRGSGEPEAS